MYRDRRTDRSRKVDDCESYQSFLRCGQRKSADRWHRHQRRDLEKSSKPDGNYDAG